MAAPAADAEASAAGEAAAAGMLAARMNDGSHRSWTVWLSHHSLRYASMEERACAAAAAGLDGIGLNLRAYRAWIAEGHSDTELTDVLGHHRLTIDPAADNTALSDTARTGEVSAAVATAVAAAFSYDHADPEGSAAAAAEVLTGQAVEQHRELLGEIVARGAEEKFVLRTAVTHSGVEVLQGERARVLVFADQRSSRAGAEDLVTGALLAVDAAWQDGTWKIAAIETFG
jgi:hypothetical protein